MIQIPATLATAVAIATGGGQSQSTFNPDMAVVFNFGARLSDSMKPPMRRAALRETEIGLAGDVDPFLRTEVYIAFVDSIDDEESEVEIEEAFGQYTALGHGMDLRFGKLRAAAGRVNRNHLDQLDFFDFPLIVTTVFGEEGLRAPGVSLSYLAPSARFNEFTVDVLVPEEGPLFGDGDAGSPVWLGHYRTFFDFSDSLSAQFGATYAAGPKDGDTSQLYGLDFVGKLRPQGTGRSLIVESEIYWYELGSPGSSTRNGGFATLAYELTKQVWAGLKYDSVELPDGSDTLRAYSAGLTFRATEFQLLRIEFQRIESSSGPDRNQLLLQAQWLIGPHKAHKY